MWRGGVWFVCFGDHHLYHWGFMKWTELFIIIIIKYFLILHFSHELTTTQWPHKSVFQPLTSHRYSTVQRYTMPRVSLGCGSYLQTLQLPPIYLSMFLWTVPQHVAQIFVHNYDLARSIFFLTCSSSPSWFVKSSSSVSSETGDQNMFPELNIFLIKNIYTITF